MIREKNEYTYRFLSRIIIEAVTPLAVGTGVKQVITDAPIARDVNGLPYIPGTALAGVFRHICAEEYYDDASIDLFFGFHQNKNSEGSLLYFSDAIIVGEEGKPIDGLNTNLESSYYDLLRNLPIRNRVCITEKGVGKKGAKFDNEVVYAGTRFCFEIEMRGKEENEYDKFKRVLAVIKNKGFRIGGNSRNGYGAVEVVDCKVAKLNLEKSSDLQDYIEKSSSLSAELPSSFNEFTIEDNIDSDSDKWIEYEMTLKPDDFFFFGSGSGDATAIADTVPVRECRIVWNSELPQRPEIKNKCILIPGTSVKGAISHRVAYNYNLLLKRYAGKDSEAKVGCYNEAVMELFGYHSENDKELKRGNVIFSDIILEEESPLYEGKLFNHVSIDYFTGGAIDGALFTDRVDTDSRLFKFNISVRKDSLKDDNVRKAFEMTLQDICNGMLPLGGSVNRGYGCFSGEITLK